MPTLQDHYFHLPLRLLLDSDELKTPFTQNPWAYIAIMKNARNVASIPLGHATGDPGDEEFVTEGPLAELIRNPNPLMDEDTFKFAIILYLEIFGEAFLLKTDKMGEPVKGPQQDGKIPNQLFFLHPPACEEIVNKEKFTLEGWKYELGTYRRRFVADSVIHLRYFNPFRPYRGLAPLDPLTRTLRSDFKAQQLNEAFLDNGADLGGWLTAERGVNPDIVKKLKADWKAKYSGAGKAGGTPLLQGGIKYTPNPRTHEDMQYAELRRMSRQEILAVYDVPPSEVGLTDDVNLATAEAFRRRMWKSGLIPKMRLISKVLDKELSVEPLLWAWDLNTIDVLQEDLQNKLLTARRYRDLGFPANQINKRLDLGMPRQDKWGDTALLVNSFVRADDVASGKLIGSSGSTKGESSRDEIVEQFQNRLQAKLSNFTYRLRVAYMGSKSLDSETWKDTLNDLLLNVYRELVEDMSPTLDPDILNDELKDFSMAVTGSLLPQLTNGRGLDERRQLFNTVKSRLNDLARAEAERCVDYLSQISTGEKPSES